MVCPPLIIVHTSVLSVMYRCQRYLGFLCIGGGGGGGGGGGTCPYQLELFSI